MEAGLGVAAELAHNQRFVISDLPGGDGGVGGGLFVPADVLVGADDVEGIAEGVVDDFDVALGVDEQCGGDEAGGVVGAGGVGEGGEEFCAGFGVGGLVGDGPEDDGGAVAVAADVLVELLLGLDEYGGVVGKWRAQ